MTRVYLEKFDDAASLARCMRSGLRWAGSSERIPKGARVFIKPNLTWRVPTPGVTVTPLALRVLVETLLERTENITIGESEGGQSCFLAEDAFEAHGLYELQREFGIKVVNLSKTRHERVTEVVGGRPISVDLSTVLLHETDAFITMPVPKVHAMTGVSLGFKNQWGCLGDAMRVTQHPHFDRMVVAINRTLAPKLCVFDGTYFLDQTGPMDGLAVRKDLLIVGDDIGAASLVACAIMGIDAYAIRHHRVALSEGLFPKHLADVTCNVAPAQFADRKFQLRRAPVNYVQLAAFRIRLLNRLFYDSRFADLLHEALWLIRRNPLVRRFLYGEYGNFAANRGGVSR